MVRSSSSFSSRNIQTLSKASSWSLSFGLPLFRRLGDSTEVNCIGMFRNVRKLTLHDWWYRQFAAWRSLPKYSILPWTIVAHSSPLVLQWTNIVWTNASVFTWQILSSLFRLGSIFVVSVPQKKHCVLLSYGPWEIRALLFTGLTESSVLEEKAMSFLFVWLTRHVLWTRVPAFTLTFTPLSMLARLIPSAPLFPTTTVSSQSKFRSHKGQVALLSDIMFLHKAFYFAFNLSNVYDVSFNRHRHPSTFVLFLFWMFSSPGLSAWNMKRLS